MTIDEFIFKYKNKFIQVYNDKKIYLIIDISKPDRDILRDADERACITTVDCGTLKTDYDWIPYIDTFEKYYKLIA